VRETDERREGGKDFGLHERAVGAIEKSHAERSQNNENRREPEEKGNRGIGWESNHKKEKGNGSGVEPNVNSWKMVDNG
jgi:hypothetical protein